MPFPISRRSQILALTTTLCVIVATIVRAEAEWPDVGGHAFAGHAALETTATPAPADTPVLLDSQHGQQWQSGGNDILLMRGRCEVTQGNVSARAPQMVVWRMPGTGEDRQERVLVYLEGNSTRSAEIRSADGIERGRQLLLELTTTAGVRHTRSSSLATLDGSQEPLFRNATDFRREQRPERSDLELTQYMLAQPPFGGPSFGSDFPQPVAGPQRSVRISPRYLGMDFVMRARVSEDTTPPEFIITVTRGVNIVVTNVPLQVEGRLVLTTIDLTADRAVIWTDNPPANEALGGLSGFQLGPDSPFQVYLEGNIVVRQGLNEARASHAFYDVNEQRGLLLNGEIRTFIPELGGDLRLRAEQIRQNSETSFHARNAWVSTSQLGRPGYRIQASDIYLEERFDPRSSRIDPATGQPTGGTPWVTSTNNQFIVEEFPLLYLPYLSGPAEDPQIPIRRLATGYDGIFGLQVESVWSLEALFGLDLPQGVDWELQADLFSQRGPGIGTRGEYDLDSSFLGIPARHEGFGQAYYINDGGEDNLGLGRRNLTFPNDNRGRATWRHRMQLPQGTWIDAELGYVSDRNFLEQYYEPEFDRDKDQETLVNLNHQIDNLTGSVLVRGRLNDFEYQTEWLPRGDLTILGEPLLGGLATWSSHSSIGYGRIGQADAPYDPTDPFQPLESPFTPLPMFEDSAGLVAMTRHELDMPFNVGPVNVVPYLLGEAAHWEEDVTQSQLSRLYGSAGVRASLMFWKAMPHIQSSVLGLNGLAHKMVFDLDYYYAQASEDLSSIPQYNEFDDNAQERFRERFPLLEFGGALPIELDPRLYALRSGAGRSVTAPYHELVDDQHVLRLGWRHRWQTKVGPPDRQRIKDWMTLDLEASIFPDADRDNFGEDIGLLGARYSWAVGERTTLLANALYDLFDNGQELWNIGVLSQRSARGSLYLGFRQVKVGTVDSQIIAASYSYRMSPKWVSTFGTSFDVAEGIDRGQSMTVTRIGEYLLVHVGAGYDRSRNNFGFGISVEPRLGYSTSSTQLSSLLGIQ